MGSSVIMLTTFQNCQKLKIVQINPSMTRIKGYSTQINELVMNFA